MTLREYYEYNVRRRRERYNYREYKPGRGMEARERHYDFAARIRLSYMTLDWRLRENDERYGDISTMTRPLTVAEWDANLERLMNEASREAAFFRNAPHFVNGDLNENWVRRGQGESDVNRVLRIQ